MPKKTKAIPDNRAERSFGETLYWHFFIFGTRPDGSPAARVGKVWDPKQAADAIGVSIRGFWNWIDDRHLPYDTANIERALFGDNAAFDEWREELRRLLREGRGASTNPVESTGRVPAIVTGQAVTVYNTPFEIAEIEGAITKADFAPPAPHGTENFGNFRKNQREDGRAGRETAGGSIGGGGSRSAATPPTSRKTVAIVCAGVLAVLGIYGVKRVTEPPRITANSSVTTIDPKPPTLPVKLDPQPAPPVAAPAATTQPQTEQERRAAAEKARQDDIRAVAQKRALDELEQVRLNKQQAAKDLNEKLRVMAQATTTSASKN